MEQSSHKQRVLSFPNHLTSEVTSPSLQNPGLSKRPALGLSVA